MRFPYHYYHWPPIAHSVCSFWVCAALDKTTIWPKIGSAKQMKYSPISIESKRFGNVSKSKNLTNNIKMNMELTQKKKSKRMKKKLITRIFDNWHSMTIQIQLKQWPEEKTWTRTTIFEFANKIKYREFNNNVVRACAHSISIHY